MTLSITLLGELENMADKETVLTQLGLTEISLSNSFNKWYELLPLKLDKLNITYAEI